MARLRGQTGILNPTNSASMSVGETAPTSPAIGQRWFRLSSGVTYQYTNDGSSSFWLDVSSGGIGTSSQDTVDFVGDTDPHIATNGTGLAVGSVYYNREKNRHFVCTDATSGANVWAGKYAAQGGNLVTDYVYSGTKYRVHKFTRSGEFFIDDATLTIDILCVGGGGGASFGGGGAGTLCWTNGRATTVGSYIVKIGLGGCYCQSGNDTSFGGNIVVAKGGGGGGGPRTNAGPALSGGSGGGGGHPSNPAAGTGEVTGSVGTLRAANNGSVGGTYWGGGGGGAGGNAPANGSNNQGSTGGVGHSSFVNSSAAETAGLLWAAKAGTNAANAITSGLGSNPGTLYIAGGGGGAYGSAPGGAGGGAVGSASSGDHIGVNAVPNCGGGGSGMNSSADYDNLGGSGICIIRYALT